MVPETGEKEEIKMDVSHRELSNGFSEAHIKELKQIVPHSWI
jgi:hypothetical protein